MNKLYKKFMEFLFLIEAEHNLNVLNLCFLEKTLDIFVEFD